MRLDELGVEEDPGTAWHPRRDKTEAWNGDDLADLSDAEVTDHRLKPEIDTQPDALRLMGAEDSKDSPDGEV